MEFCGHPVRLMIFFFYKVKNVRLEEQNVIFGMHLFSKAIHLTCLVKRIIFSDLTSGLEASL